MKRFIFEKGRSKPTAKWLLEYSFRNTTGNRVLLKKIWREISQLFHFNITFHFLPPICFSGERRTWYRFQGRWSRVGWSDRRGGEAEMKAVIDGLRLSRRKISRNDNISSFGATPGWNARRSWFPLERTAEMLHRPKKCSPGGMRRRRPSPSTDGPFHGD